MNSNDPNEKDPGKRDGEPPIPEKWLEPPGKEFERKPKETSVGITILKVIGYLILAGIALIALAFGTCLIMLSNH